MMRLVTQETNSNQTYRGLERVQSNYWKKYSRSNNFWDYMRIINFFDRSLFDQLSKLVPVVNTTLGLLIEPNILERSKEVVGKIPEFENSYFENAGHFDDGLQLSSRISSSREPNPFMFSSQYLTYNGYRKYTQFRKWFTWYIGFTIIGTFK